MVFFFGCLTEFEGKTTLPKTPHILHIEFRRVKLELDKNTPPCGLVLIIYNDVSMQGAREKISQ